MIHEKRSAGGLETTTADSTAACRSIAFRTWLKAAIIRYATMLATYFRGLA